MSDVTCPVCRSTVTGPAVHHYTVERAAAHFCPPSRDPERTRRMERVIERLWGGRTAAVYRCGSCGFGFSWPYVGGDEEFYGILHENAGYPPWRWEYGVTQTQVLPGYTPGRILDIGTGDGAFLLSLKPGWNLFATEGSEATRAALRAKGIECLHDTADAVRSAAGTFEVVTTFQVLEHLDCFAQVLRDCRALLKPGGSLVVAVPLGEATFAQEALTGCADMTPNHVNKWSPEALARAMRDAGLAPQPPQFEPNSWRLATYRASLKMRARISREPQSLAARVYGMRRSKWRNGIFRILGISTMLSALPHYRQYARGHTFLIVGQSPPKPSADKPATAP